MAPLTLENCKTRFQLCAYLIYKYLILKDDVEIIFDQLPPKGKTITHRHYMNTYKMEKGDHVIVVDNKGFHDRSTTFNNKLKENIKGAIVSVNISNVYYCGEDMMFFMDNCCNLRKNTICINWLCDSEELYPTKNENSIRILVQQPKNNTIKSFKKYQEMVNKIIKFKSANKEHINIEVGCYANNHYRDLSTNEITQLDNYEMRYDIFRKTDIYFIMSNCFDRDILYSLGLCNVLFVSHESFINPKIIDDFDIIFYKNIQISWEKIISKLNNVKSREKVINSGLNCKTSIDKIFNYVSLYTKFRDPDQVKEDNKIKSSKLYASQKRYERELKNLTKRIEASVPASKKTDQKSNENKETNKKPVEREKGKRLIQSKLRFTTW